MTLKAEPKWTLHQRVLLEEASPRPFWKCYRVENNLLYPPVFDGGGAIMVPGWVVSDRKVTWFSYNSRVNKGIHVRLRMTAGSIMMSEFWHPGYFWMKVWGHLEHFVAAGLGEAVFTKILIRHSDLEDVITRSRKQKHELENLRVERKAKEDGK